MRSDSAAQLHEFSPVIARTGIILEMFLANDNDTDAPYRIVESRYETGVPHWYVSNPQRNTARRISVRFPTLAQAERARDVLIADDRRRA